MAQWFKVFVFPFLLGCSSAMIIMGKGHSDHDGIIYEEFIIGIHKPQSHSLQHAVEDVVIHQPKSPSSSKSHSFNLAVEDLVIHQPKSHSSSKSHSFNHVVEDIAPLSEHRNGCFSLKNIMKRITGILMLTKRDPHHLMDEKFSVPSKNSVVSGLNKVTLNEGRFFGMSDFEVLQSNLSDYLSDFWFGWSHMRAMYAIGIDDVNGQKYVGNCEVDLGPLFMHIRILCSNVKAPKIEMSEVGDVKEFKIAGLESLSTEMRTATESQVKNTIMTYTNSKIRFQLRNCVKRILSEVAIKTKRPSNRLKDINY